MGLMVQDNIAVTGDNIYQRHCKWVRMAVTR